MIVYVNKERLTFIGENRDEVVVGPSEYNEGQTESKCFASGSLTQTWRIQNVTMQNSWNGLYNGGGVYLENCCIEGCRGSGIFTGAPGGLNISHCVFVDNYDGLFSFAPCSGISIVDSEFTSSSISLQNTTDVTIEGCTISGGLGGVQFDHSTGSVVDCVITDMTSLGLAMISHSSVVIEGCDIEGTSAGHHWRGGICRCCRFLSPRGRGKAHYLRFFVHSTQCAQL